MPEASGPAGMKEGDAEVDQIRALETKLLRAEVRESAEQLSSILADDFIEFGASGRVYDKNQAVEAVTTAQKSDISMTDFAARILAPGVIFVTYGATKHTSVSGPSVSSLRSSVWKLIDGKWQVIFHQGTPSDAA